MIAKDKKLVNAWPIRFASLCAFPFFVLGIVALPFGFGGWFWCFALLIEIVLLPVAHRCVISMEIKKDNVDFLLEYKIILKRLAVIETIEFCKVNRYGIVIKGRIGYGIVVCNKILCTRYKKKIIIPRIYGAPLIIALREKFEQEEETRRWLQKQIARG